MKLKHRESNIRVLLASLLDLDFNLPFFVREGVPKNAATLGCWTITDL